jgi:hypothetical protein
VPDDTFVCSACTEVPFRAGMASIPRCESPAAFSIFARLQVSSYLQIVRTKIIENRKTGVTLLCKHGSGAQASKGSRRHTTLVRYRTGEALFTNSAKATMRRTYHVSPAPRPTNLQCLNRTALDCRTACSSRELGNTWPRGLAYHRAGIMVDSVGRLHYELN